MGRAGVLQPWQLGPDEGEIGHLPYPRCHIFRVTGVEGRGSSSFVRIKGGAGHQLPENLITSLALEWISISI